MSFEEVTVLAVQHRSVGSNDFEVSVLVAPSRRNVVWIGPALSLD